MIKTFNHYTKLNYGNTNIFGYLSQEILMFIKILLFWIQAAINLNIVFNIKTYITSFETLFSIGTLEKT
jgi:hypothetical protein